MSNAPADFVLRVDKPEGPSSHDVVRAARRALGVRRVGHTGTLDPFASGLLLLCVGRATRLAEYLSDLDKTYEAVARLGVSTDTLDREGTVVAKSDSWKELDITSIEAVLPRFRGEITQVPPQYSAKKVDGERAYLSARAGRSVELAPETVHIRALELTSVELPNVRFTVTCSSGTYVRALARDIGKALAVGAHLTALRRSAIGGWSVEGALAVEELDDPHAVASAAVAPLAALGHLTTVEVDDEVAGRLALGQAVRIDEEGLPPTVAVAHHGALIAVGEADNGVLRPRKVFAA